MGIHLHTICVRKCSLVTLSFILFKAKTFDLFFIICSLRGCVMPLFYQVFKLLLLFSNFNPMHSLLPFGVYNTCLLYTHAHCTHSQRVGNCGNAIAMTIKSGKTAVRHTSNKMNMEHIAILFTHVIQIMNEFTRINVPHQKPYQTSSESE